MLCHEPLCIAVTQLFLLLFLQTVTIINATATALAQALDMLLFLALCHNALQLAISVNYRSSCLPYRCLLQAGCFLVA